MSQVVDKEQSKARELKRIEGFTKGTWTALAFATLCIVVDAYFVVYIPLHRSSTVLNLYHPSLLFRIGLRAIEVSLAFIAGWLLRQAFSRPPRLNDKS